jgi:phage tail sheath protein FI
MATNFNSPGVYVLEKDISEFTPSINTSVVGVVGFASKGPTNKATLITDQNALIRTFGQPSENIPGQALEGALEILEQTNTVYFVRAANDDTATDASAIVSVGGCPSVIVSGPATVGTGFGVSVPLTLRVQVYDNNGTPQYTSPGKDFVIPASTATYQAEAIRKILGGGLDSDKIGVFDGGSYATGLGLSGAIIGSYAGSGASIGVSACSGTSFLAASGVSALAVVSALNSANASFGAESIFASAVRAYGYSFVQTGVSSASYLVESLYPGTGYNGGTRSDGTASGNSLTITNLGSQNFTVVVNEAGTVQESFKASLVASGSFLEDVINTGEVSVRSDIIKGNLLKDGSNAVAVGGTNFSTDAATIFGGTGFKMTSQFLPPNANPTGAGTPTAQNEVVVANGGRWNKLVATSLTNLAGGTNGTGTENQNAVALIGDAASEPKTGMQALDNDEINIGIAVVPDIHTESVQNALLTLAESTQNFIGLVSPPYGVGTAQDAIDWCNGRSSSTAGSRTSPINNSYAAVYWPWLKVFSVFDGVDRWYDPVIFAARQMAFTDTVAESWFAPAGFQRGRLTKPTEVEVKLNQGDRDSLYSGGNVVNPIVSFPQQGITIFGQRTTQREPTALDRINIRRLMIYVRKVLLASARRFVFEPNDEFTWAQVEGVVNPFLDDIRRRRGITEFRVVCDETVNTPVRVDRNELWCKVLIKPTKTAEIIIFELNLTSQGANLGNL